MSDRMVLAQLWVFFYMPNISGKVFIPQNNFPISTRQFEDGMIFTNFLPQISLEDSWEMRFSCCSSGPNGQACTVSESHVTNTAFWSDLSGFIEIPAPSDPSDSRNGKIYVLDSEMVYTRRGLSIARVTLVNCT
ncbi:unnamed protein product [Dracunculus medinensis]|uniref:Neur_chan_LBD domain-containing protein n=1 Tax=Dracunculus medinensis TaxID=318479 RepID=A0A0N4UR51_DRAME|nr:unnamed protein product [Dracunculus medinensis]